jgi:Coenzyme PQQ synthesis protein D (PqqD)
MAVRVGMQWQLRDGDLDWREVEGQLVALDLRQSRYLAVNRTGRVLWAALAEGATRDELIERLIEAFAIDRSRAAEDVDAFTADLESRDLLIRKQSAT